MTLQTFIKIRTTVKNAYPKLYFCLRKGSGVFKGIIPILRGRKGSFNYALCCLSAVVESQKSFGRPMLLTIEPINVCDQKCLICETGQNQLGRKARHMSLSEFKHILGQFDSHLRTLYFYFMGESFLNREAYDMIRHAADRGLFVSACTNGNQLNPEQLVRSGISEIQFQIAGTTQETHSTYRIGGDLATVLSNVRETVRLKKDLGPTVSRPYPMQITLGLILMKHNEHQMREFESLAFSLGVDSHQIIDPCVRTVKQGQAMLPTDRNHWIYDPKAFERGELRPRASACGYCEWIYGTMTILANGDVVPCCRDPKGKNVLGNALRENVYTIWNNSSYHSIRRAVAKKQSHLALCELCEGYGMPRI